MESSWYGLVERAKNFHGYVELPQEEVERMEPLFKGLQAAYEHTIAILDKSHNLSGEQLLRIVFAEIYHNIILSSKFLINSNDFSIFDDDSPFCADVFNACFFTLLCTFVTQSKRIKGLSLREFLYKHSPHKYNDKMSEYYFDIGDKHKQKYSSTHKFINQEENSLRKSRNRSFSEREVYVIRDEWSAIPKSSEDEWAFYGVLNSDSFNDDLRDTYKRIGNLYNDVNSAIHELAAAPEDSDFSHELEEAYKKFLSKLKKINYEKLLELTQKILSHICEDKSYYGINIYRFEKRLRLYNIVNEVKCLLKCQSEEEENYFLEKTIALNNVYFPKVYQDISALERLKSIVFYADKIKPFMKAILQLGFPFLDAIVEHGYFGENWEKLFVDTINDMTESVFYSLDEIDYTVTPESQEKYVKLCSAYVRRILDVAKILSHEERRNLRIYR